MGAQKLARPTPEVVSSIVVVREDELLTRLQCSDFSLRDESALQLLDRFARAEAYLGFRATADA